MTKAIALVAILSLFFHILFGWMWVVLAAIGGGWMYHERGWAVGGIGVSLSWILLVGYNYLVAPFQVSEMTRVMASLFGGLPSLSIPLLTVIIGIIIGTVGGALGSAMAAFFNRKNR